MMKNEPIEKDWCAFLHHLLQIFPDAERIPLRFPTGVITANYSPISSTVIQIKEA
jgi:hypothetical protein